MLKVGLTGGIGSGKSTVARIFEVLGIPVFYADDETKKLMNEDDVLKKKIMEGFGEKSYVNGELNRAFISSIVFNNQQKLALLNSITHPAIIRHTEDWMKKQTSAYAIKEAALIFESGSDKHLDKVICVYAPEELRIARVMKRDGISREEVLKRISRQMNEDEKMKRCDFVLMNDEQQLLLPQVMKLHDQLLQLI